VWFPETVVLLENDVWSIGGRWLVLCDDLGLDE
jgi:hypothetical protein